MNMSPLVAACTGFALLLAACCLLLPPMLNRNYLATQMSCGNFSCRNPIWLILVATGN